MNEKEKERILGREKNKAFYEQNDIVTDMATGEIISASKRTVVKKTPEPDYIKVYYETMLAFNQIHDVPVSFVISLSRFLEWSNDGNPQCATLNKRVKEIMCQDCHISLPQLNRYIKTSVENGLLFRTPYRAVYEVNPFLIAKGKWESIRELRTNFDYVNGKWTRVMTETDTSDEDSKQLVKQLNEQLEKNGNVQFTFTTTSEFDDYMTNFQAQE